jgi:hypothetical protein
VKGIKISRNTDINTLLFADDQVTVADSKDGVKSSVHKLEIITSKYGLKFSKSKAKSMAFKERDTMRSKIVINSDIIEEINTINYPGCSISYQNERDSFFFFSRHYNP